MMMMRLRPTMAVLAVLSIGVFVGCSDDDNGGTTPAPSLQVQIAATPSEALTGGTIELTAQVSTTKVDYTYFWSATGGTFTATNTATTNWTAPDEDATYEITCIVSDGAKAAVGKKSIVASEYAPLVDPHYIGAATCNSCHGEVYAEWSAKSGHAGAYAALAEIGMGGNANCIGCHSVGFDAAVANGGYDEQKVERLQNVQCENCHGPGSAHKENPTGGLPKDLTPALCGSCHEGEHHPTFSEWEASPHGRESIEETVGRSPCASCHNGSQAMKYLDDPTTTVFQGAPADTFRIACVVCHDPHGNDNHANLRNAVNDIALPDGVHPDAGAGRLCIACHNGRRTPENIASQIQNGGRIGPHHSCQGDMLAGTGAYELVNPDFTFRASNHLKIQGGCINCHTHHVATQLPFYTGHNFTPTTAACTQCHGPINAFTDITAKDDYDADGAVEGVQLEVTGLLENLADTIIEAGATPEDQLALQAAYDGGTFATALGDTSLTSIDMRKSAYNYLFVEFDASKGVHNATYAIQLLQQSILALQPGALKSGKILVE